MTKKGKI